MVRKNVLLMSLSCVATALKPPFLCGHSHTSSDYSDWTADAGINLQPSTPLSSRKRARRPLSSSEEEDEAAASAAAAAEDDEEEKRQSDEESSGVKKSKQKARKPKSKTPRVGSLVRFRLWRAALLCFCFFLFFYKVKAVQGKHADTRRQKKLADVGRRTSTHPLVPPGVGWVGLQSMGAGRGVG